MAKGAPAFLIPFIYNENNVDISGNWDAHLDLGLDLRIGAEVEVLGKDLLSYQSNNINLFTETVWESSYEKTLINLISPENGAVLDNGCQDFSDLIEWYFDWDDFPSAERYHLFVIGSSAQYPVIDNDNIEVSEYLSSEKAYVIPSNAKDWTWKVRAYVNGEWIGWSEERTFDVEPINTDCN